MMTFTGLVAIVLIFLSGPYRTFQRRWPKTWGPRLPVWAHINISLAAAGAILIHIAPRLGKIGPGLPWFATGLLAVTVFSGLYGMRIATSAPSRKRWLKVHWLLTYVFYLSIMAHVFAQSGLAMVLAVPMGWALWRWRLRIREFMVRASRPFSK